MGNKIMSRSDKVYKRVEENGMPDFTALRILPTGVWVRSKDEKGWICSECKAYLPDSRIFWANYCYCCGAEMYATYSGGYREAYRINTAPMFRKRGELYEGEWEEALDVFKGHIGSLRESNEDGE